MIVLDASVVVEMLLELPRARAIRARLERAGGDALELAAPQLLDAQVAQVLCRLVLHDRVRLARAQAALEDLAALPITRHPHLPLLPRAFALRDHATVYDALYLALAEILEAVLLTADPALAHGSGSPAQVECIAP
jgi:predicted nucleic acid-binding protein